MLSKNKVKIILRRVEEVERSEMKLIEVMGAKAKIAGAKEHRLKG